MLVATPTDFARCLRGGSKILQRSAFRLKDNNADDDDQQVLGMMKNDDGDVSYHRNGADGDQKNVGMMKNGDLILL